MLHPFQPSFTRAGLQVFQFQNIALRTTVDTVCESLTLTRTGPQPQKPFHTGLKTLVCNVLMYTFIDDEDSALPIEVWAAEYARRSFCSK